MIISFRKSIELRMLTRYHISFDMINTRTTPLSKAKFTMAIKWPEVRKRVPFYYSRDSLPTSCSVVHRQRRLYPLSGMPPLSAIDSHRFSRLVMNFALHRRSTLKLAHDPLFQTFHPFIYFFFSSVSFARLTIFRLWLGQSRRSEIISTR